MKKHNINKSYSLQKMNGTLQGKLSVDKRNRKKTRKIDILLIVFSLMIATVIWLFASSNTAQEKEFALQIDPMGEQQLFDASGLKIFSELPEITVKVSGKASDIAKVEATDIVPVINVAYYRAAAGEATFTIEFAQNQDLKKVTLEAFPKTVTVLLDQTMKKTVNVLVEKAYNVDSVSFEPTQTTMEIEGPKTEIETIDHIQLLITSDMLPSEGESDVVVVMPIFVDKNGISVDDRVTHVGKAPMAVIQKTVAPGEGD